MEFFKLVRTIKAGPNWTRAFLTKQECDDKSMRDSLKQKIIEVCKEKIEKKGTNVGLSFYAFFSNKNDDPLLLMEAAKWWIMEQRLDHFEKAVKIKKLVEGIQ